MQSQTPNQLSPIHKWLLAIRPKTLPAAAAPVILGWSIANTTGKFNWSMACAALISALMIQIGTNLVNDVSDFTLGADTVARTGPVREHRPVCSPPNKCGWVFGSHLASQPGGLYLMLHAGWVVLVIGLASIAAGILYTAGPYPLAYIGLGGLFVMIFFGFVAVCGTVFVTSGMLPMLAWSVLPRPGH